MSSLKNLVDSRRQKYNTKEPVAVKKIPKKRNKKNTNTVKAPEKPKEDIENKCCMFNPEDLKTKKGKDPARKFKKQVLQKLQKLKNYD